MLQACAYRPQVPAADSEYRTRSDSVASLQCRWTCVCPMALWALGSPLIKIILIINIIESSSRAADLAVMAIADSP